MAKAMVNQPFLLALGSVLIHSNLWFLLVVPHNSWFATWVFPDTAGKDSPGHKPLAMFTNAHRNPMHRGQGAIQHNQY